MGLTIGQRQERTRLLPLGLKRCGECKRILPLGEFYDCRRNSTDGKRSQCKDCLNGGTKRRDRFAHAKGLLAQNLKVCSGCGRILPLHCFSRSRRDWSGLSNNCKDCDKARHEASGVRTTGKRKAEAKEWQALAIEGLKRCAVCREIRPVTDFYKNKYTRDGLMPQCKYCCGYKGACEKKRQRAAELEAEGKKQCYSCGKIKPIEVFAPSQRHLLTAPCRECRRKRCNIVGQRRRAKQNNLPNTFTQENWREVKQYWDNKCVYCGKEGEVQQDHFVSVAQGGGYTMANVIPACAYCNQSKGAKNPFEWAEASPQVSRGAIQDIEKYLHLVAERR